MGMEFIEHVPWLVWPALALVVMVALARAGAGRQKRTDPRRMFSADERRAGFERAGNQCEFARWMFFRCTRTASHGDHYFPWSKGGATSMLNYVAACARCNTSKGARMPTALDRALLRARRARYFPAHIPRDVGEWFGAVR